MKLYHFQGARSTRVRWMLEEVGAPHELIPVNILSGEQRSATHLARHPHGHVPVLTIGDTTLIESCAIVMHLADAHPDKGLAPPLGTIARAKYYQWITYAAATVDVALSSLFRQSRLPEEMRLLSVIAEAEERFAVAVHFLASHLQESEYLVGDAFTAADLAIGWDLAFAHFLGKLPKDGPIAGYYARLAERPAFKRAYTS